MKQQTLIFFITILLISNISNAQCWKSLDIKGDTNMSIFAIRNDNTLWDFTYNSTGVQIGTQNIWEKCFSSTNSNFLIAKDSSLWGWGNNNNGELGIGNTNSQNSIIQLNSSKWISFSSSWGACTAIKKDGTMWFWGTVWPQNPILSPLKIGIDNNWIDVKSTYGEVLALKSNGTLWKGSPGSTLVQVGTDTDWKYIWAEQDEWWGIKNNGTLWYNGVQVGNDINWKLIKGHMYAGTYGIKTNGSLWYWSNYNPSSPGSVITFNPLSSPIQISTISNCNQISICNDYNSQQGASIYCIHDNDKLWLEKYSIDVSCPMTSASIQAPYITNTIKVYPNPAKDHITIDFGNYANMNGYTLKITNSLGASVFTTAIYQQTSYVDLKGLTGNGIYLVELIDAENNTLDFWKIVIQ